MKITSLILLVFAFFFPLSTNSFCEEFRFESQILAYEKQDVDTQPRLGATLFVGSSTWRLWTEIPNDFKTLNAVNRGFGGSKISEIVFVMDRIILPLKPSRIIFFCGSNDIANGLEPEKAFTNFKEFLARLWNECPQCDVYFISVTHAPVREKFWKKGDVLNALVQEHVKKTPRLHYIDILPVIKDSEGRVRDELFLPDRLHLSRDGQKTWIPVILDAVSSNSMYKCIAPPCDLEKNR